MRCGVLGRLLKLVKVEFYVAQGELAPDERLIEEVVKAKPRPHKVIPGVRPGDADQVKAAVGKA